MAKRTRRRRGHPKGKAYGFNGLRPAAKTQSSSDDSSQSGASTSGQSTQSTASSDQS